MEIYLAIYNMRSDTRRVSFSVLGWTCDAPLVGAHLLASHALQVSVKQETLIEKVGATVY